VLKWGEQPSKPSLPSGQWIVQNIFTQSVVPADRFAREILAILTLSAVRSRQLNAKPFGGAHQGSSHLHT
jgi:hypothetical protein